MSYFELESLVVNLLADAQEANRVLAKFEADLQGAAAVAQKTAADISKSQKKAMAEAARVISSVMTPQEKYTAQLKRLKQLHEAGHLPLDMYNRAVQRAGEQLPAFVAQKKKEAEAVKRSADLVKKSLNPYKEYGLLQKEIFSLRQQGAISLKDANAALAKGQEIMQRKIRASQQYINQQKQDKKLAKDKANQLALQAHLERAAMTAEEKHREVLRGLNDQFNKGAISQRTYNRLVDQAWQRHPAIIKATKERNALQAQANKLTQQALSPAQQYQQKISNLRNMLNQGMISQQTYNYHVRQAQSEMSNISTHGVIPLARSIQNLGMQIRMVGAMWSAAFTAPIVGGVIAAANEYGKFEKQIVNTFAILNNRTAGQKGMMSKGILDMSMDSVLGPVELAKGMNQLATSGYDAEQGMKALGVTSKFAVAAEMELQGATKALSEVLSVLRMRVADPVENMLQMQWAADVLSKAADDSEATISGLAESITNKAGASAAQLNKDITETVAVLEVLARQGDTGASAGEHLAITWRDLQRAFQRAPDTWRAWGISVFDANGKMAHTADILDMLENAMKGLTDEQVRMLLTELEFQDKSINTIRALFGTSEAIRDFQAALQGAAGHIDRVAEEKLGSFLNALAKTWSKLQVVATELGDRLAPYILMVNDAISDAIIWWRQLDKATQSAILLWAGILAVVGPVLIAFGTLVTIAASVVGAIAGILAVGGTFIGTVLAIAAGVAAAIAQLGIFVAAIEVLYQMFTGESLLLQMWNSFVEKITLATKAVIGFTTNLQYNLGVIKKYWNHLWQNAWTIFGRFIASIVGNWLRSWRMMGRIVTAVIGYVISVLANLPETIPAYFNKAWKLALQGATAFGKAIWNIITGMMKGETFDANALGATIGDDFTKGLEGSLMGNISRIVNEELGAMQSAVSDGVFDSGLLWDNLRTGIPAAINETTEAVKQQSHAMEGNGLAAKQMREMQEEGNSAYNSLTGTIRDMTASLKEQAMASVLTRRELELWKLQQKGASEAQIAHIDTLSRYTENLEMAKEIYERHKTPVQKFEEEQAKLNELFQSGFLDLEHYNLEWQRLYEELQKEAEVKISFNTDGVQAMEAGAAATEAYLDGINDKVTQEAAMQQQLAAMRPDPMQVQNNLEMQPNRAAEMSRFELSNQVSQIFDRLATAVERQTEQQSKTQYVMLRPSHLGGA